MRISDWSSDVCSSDLKNGIVDGRAADIVYSNLFTGVHGNYLRQSIVSAGMDPENLPEGDLKTMNFGSGGNTKVTAWKDIWGSGQGIGPLTTVRPVAEFVAALEAQYLAARRELDAKGDPEEDRGGEEEGRSCRSRGK